MNRDNKGAIMRRWRCPVCKKVWDEAETMRSMRHYSRICGDIFCGATVQEVKEEQEQSK